jgi:hypothetical protein
MSDSTTRDGGPAFPRTGEGFGNPRYDTPGMTLRDYFAAQAIPQMILKSEDNEGGWDPAAVAAGCYAVADAMLEYRSDEPDLDPRTPKYGVAP